MSDVVLPPKAEVGYKRPPKDKQFKKGQTGNPKGRPKGKKSIQQLLQDELYSTIKVVIDGKECQHSKAQLMVKRLVNDALKGNIKAFQSIRQICPSAFDESHIGDTHDDAADQQFLTHYFGATNKDGANG